MGEALRRARRNLEELLESEGPSERTVLETLAELDRLIEKYESEETQ